MPHLVEKCKQASGYLFVHRSVLTPRCVHHSAEFLFDREISGLNRYTSLVQIRITLFLNNCHLPTTTEIERGSEWGSGHKRAAWHRRWKGAEQRMDSDVQVAGEGDWIGVDHVAPVEELSRPPSSKSVSFTDVQRALSSREGQRTSSSQFAEPAEWREKEEPIGKKDTVLSRRSAGSTPFNERLEHRSQDYSRTVEHYRSLPSVTDYPYQARNPALVKPNPVSFFCEHRHSVCGSRL